jgi:hypothetical protein
MVEDNGDVAPIQSQDKTPITNKVHPSKKIIFIGVILILIVFYVLRVQNLWTQTTTQLIAHGGCIGNYYCHAPLMKSNGKLNMSILQSSGMTLENVKLMCTTGGGAVKSYEFVPIANLGIPSGDMETGIVYNITGLQCYYGNGSTVSGLIPGESFTVGMMINYTNSRSIPDFLGDVNVTVD